MLIAIFGGSFNPIHYGHTGLAKWVVEHTEIDELWLMVTPNNPLKEKDMLSDEQQRLQAAREALSGVRGVRVSDFEFGLPRPSYTANTLRALAAKYPEHRFALLIGEDNWRIRKRWREWEYIEQNFAIYVYPRQNRSSETGAETGKSSLLQKEIDESEGEVHYLSEAPLFDISSTEIRQRAEREH